MRIEEWDILQGLLVEAAKSSMAAAGVDCTHSGNVPLKSVAWPEMFAIIGLGGSLHGSLVVSLSSGLLRRTHPAKATGVADLADWLAELTNLMLGSIKRRLLAHGISTELSTPLILSATTLRFERFAGVPIVHAFAVGDEFFHVVFAAVAEKDVFLKPEPGPTVEPGEMVTF